MDEKTLEILAEKIQSPEISLADIGRKKNLTRQAIHKYIKNRCKEIPELAAVFNRQNEKTTTFMEAVCQIRQKSSERNSKKPELNSSSFRSLTSLHLSLDLSRLSIGKDLNFWKTNLQSFIQLTLRWLKFENMRVFPFAEYPLFLFISACKYYFSAVY